jgi:hypothetical protein
MARADDRGEMLLLMFGITAVLLGIAGVLVQQLGRPLAVNPAEASQNAAVAAGSALRQQALREGLGAAGVDRLDLPAACAAAATSATADGYVLADCHLAPTGLSVVAARDPNRDAAVFGSATVALADAPGGCLALRTGWGVDLPAICPSEPR